MKHFNILKILVFLFITTTGLNAQNPFVQWNFNNDDTVANIGNGTIALVGGTTNTFASGSGSSDTATPNRGFNTSTYAALGTENKERGIQIDASTAGYTDIVLTFDQRLSNTANNTYTIQYTTDVTATSVVWTDMETLTLTPAETGVGDTWHNIRTVDFSSVTALNDNEDAAFRIVSSFDPVVGDYTAARSTSSYGTGGTVRFDMITFSGNVISADPVLTLTPATLEFSQTLGAPSTAQSVTVYGANLISDITLDAYAPFEVALTEDGTYAATQTLTITDGGFSGNVFVRLNSATAGSFEEVLTAQTTGTLGTSVNLSGETTASLVTNPTPFDLSTGSYTFTEWNADSTAGTYPNNMAFWAHATTDPSINTEFIEDYTCLYNLESRSRIVGENENGVSFVNTGNSQYIGVCDGSDPTQSSGDTVVNGRSGAAVLALNTLNRENIEVEWTGRTIVRNFRLYALRLQYRIGDGGGNPNIDWLDANSEYVANDTENHSETFTVTLPEDAENQEVVQLRWVYIQHEDNTASGARAHLALDDVTVSSEETASVSGFEQNTFRMYPNPTTNVVNFSKEISATVFDITGKKVLSFENATSVNVSQLNKGVYFVKTTEGTVSKLIKK